MTQGREVKIFDLRNRPFGMAITEHTDPLLLEALALLLTEDRDANSPVREPMADAVNQHMFELGGSDVVYAVVQADLGCVAAASVIPRTYDDPPTTSVAEFAVRPDMRRQHIGTELARFIAQQVLGFGDDQLEHGPCTTAAGEAFADSLGFERVEFNGDVFLVADAGELAATLQ